jgi:hypothetical protein
MSVATLKALAATIEAAMNVQAAAAGIGPIQVYDGDREESDMVYPCIILHTYERHKIRTGGRRGNSPAGAPASPNIYTLVYLDRLANERGVSVEVAGLSVEQRADHLEAVFDQQANTKLFDANGNPQVIDAGQHVHLMGGEEGYYLTYGGNKRMGFKGAITVLENDSYVIY